jgi:hypothetical protein
MQAIIQKYLQSALFYLLVAVLIMMAGIIVGYLWSGNIGQWTHDRYYSDVVSVSTLLAFIGTFFTVLTYLLALKVYHHWKHPFILDKHNRLVALRVLITKLLTLNVQYQKSLIELRKADSRSFLIEKNHTINKLFEYEEMVDNIGAYDDLLLKLADNPEKCKTFALQFSLHIQIQSLILAGSSDDIDWTKYDNQRSLVLQLATAVSQQLYQRIGESANKLPS